MVNEVRCKLVEQTNHTWLKKEFGEVGCLRYLEARVIFCVGFPSQRITRWNCLGSGWMDLNQCSARRLTGVSRTRWWLRRNRLGSGRRCCVLPAPTFRAPKSGSKTTRAPSATTVQFRACS